MEILKKIVKWLGILLLVLMAVLLLIGLIPVPNDGFPSNPNPMSSYKTAVSRVNALLEEEIAITNESSRSIFFDTGEGTDEVYVLIHGLTNAPKEFAELGELLHDQGHNVIILRMPYHGLKGLDIKELDPLTAGDIRAYADEVVDIASGLGDSITVIGISGGGATGSWIAQNRPGVERVVLLSPFFGIAQTPMFLDPIVMNLLLRLPPLSISRSPKPNHDWLYSGESGRGAAVFMTIGQSVLQKAQGAPPAVKDILILTTASDLAVDNGWARRMADEWRAGGANVETFEFEKALDIPHASIDPFTEASKREQVYDQIFAWLDER